MKKQISYTILNPFSGRVIMDRIPANRVGAMTRYFAWLTGVSASYLRIEKTSKKPLTNASV